MAARDIRLGLTENLPQFSVLSLMTLLVGAAIGAERVALPPLAASAFGISSILATVAFVAVFGAVKAVMNLVAGRLSDRAGRRTLLLLGWAFGLPYPLLIIWAPNWYWVLAANALLGVNQGLTWSMSVTAKIDLVGPVRRGLAVGIDEAAGYAGTGLGGYAGGLLAAAYGLRPAPYAFALGVIVLGGLLTVWPTRETLPWAAAEAAAHGSPGGRPAAGLPPLRRLFAYMTLRDPTTFAMCQGGFLNKFVDGLVIGFFPLYLLGRGLSLVDVGLTTGVYAAVWGLGQIPSGALADRAGRKGPIVAGIALIGTGLVGVRLANVLPGFVAGGAVMGIGMALCYPTFIAVIGDVAHPRWRGGALGVYRLCRDAGYAAGPIVLGAVAGAFGMGTAIWVAAGLMGGSALIVLAMMRESEPGRRTAPPVWQAHPELLGGPDRGRPGRQAPTDPSDA